MTTTLIDTCILIAALEECALARSFLAARTGQLAISPATVTLLVAAATSPAADDRARTLLEGLDIARLDLDGYRRAGQYLRTYGASHGVDFADAVIAASAEQHGLALATLNIARFPMFPDLRLPYRA